jgi:hypothetical protein
LSSQEPYQPIIDPAAFSATVDNPYFPLPPGAQWVMEGSGESAGEEAAAQAVLQLASGTLTETEYASFLRANTIEKKKRKR